MQRRELEYAATRLRTLEINATFYGPQKASTFATWADSVPDDFVFAIKGTKAVTVAGPGTLQRHLTEFVESGFLSLGNKLGPVLWQFQDGQAFVPRQVEALLASLPQSVRHAVEVRHPSFDSPDFFTMLREHRVSLVITNTPGHPALREQLADFVYVRLHSGVDHLPNGYGDADLAAWSERIRGWWEADKDVFVYFNSPDVPSTRPPFDAMRLQQLVDA